MSPEDAYLIILDALRDPFHHAAPQGRFAPEDRLAVLADLMGGDLMIAARYQTGVKR